MGGLAASDDMVRVYLKWLLGMDLRGCEWFVGRAILENKRVLLRVRSEVGMRREAIGSRNWNEVAGLGAYSEVSAMYCDAMQ